MNILIGMNKIINFNGIFIAVWLLICFTFDFQPADTELLKLYAELDKDAATVAKKYLQSEITCHASLAMALSNVDEEDEEKILNIAQLAAGKDGAVTKGKAQKRTFVAHTNVPSQQEVSSIILYLFMHYTSKLESSSLWHHPSTIKTSLQLYQTLHRCYYVHLIHVTANKMTSVLSNNCNHCLQETNMKHNITNWTLYRDKYHKTAYCLISVTIIF